MNDLLHRARQAFTNLSSREQRLVTLMGAIFGLLLTGVPLFLMWSTNTELQADNEALRGLIARLGLERNKLQQTAHEQEAAMARYNNPAPPLGSYIESLAKAQQITIREVTEEPAKTVGGYQRRQVKVTLPDVGLSQVMHLLDSIERSPHPVAVEHLTVDHTKSGDAYDVKVGVVTFERKGKQAAGAASEDDPAEEG